MSAIVLKPNTRYLVRTGITPQVPAGVLKDVVVAEISQTNEFVRVVWEASPDGVAPPVSQEWLLAADVSAMVVEELAALRAQVHRAASVPGFPRLPPGAIPTRGPPL